MIRDILQALGVRYRAEDELVAIAKGRCVDEGWPWEEPVLLQRGPFRTMITTNSNMRGGNVRILINAKSGQIVQAGFAPR